MHYGGSGSQRAIYLKFYCDEAKVPKKDTEDRRPGKICRYSTKKKGGLAAITFRSPGWLWSDYHILLCPFWLGDEPDAPKFSTLKALAYEADSYPTLRTGIDRWSRTLRAVTLYHETAHWQDVSYPYCDSNEEYRPEYIVGKAQSGEYEHYSFNQRNAHSWVRCE